MCAMLNLTHLPGKDLVGLQLDCFAVILRGRKPFEHAMHAMVLLARSCRVLPAR